MTGQKWVVLVAALGAVTLLRAPEAASQEVCGSARDQRLVVKVEAKLANVGSVVVTAKDCVVTLAGTVLKHGNIVEAERIAASVEGVRRVRNTLRVTSAWETAPEPR
jgi:osmotically-inducible protein OsmY